MTNDASSVPANKGLFSQAYGLKSPADTIAQYRKWAATYDKEVGEENAYAQPARATAALISLLPDLNPNSVEVLDVGCGSGLSGAALAAAGFSQLDGCDFSAEMLAEARSKAIYRNLTQVDLNEGLPEVCDNSYDALTAVGVFSFGHVKPSAVQELLRVLKPDSPLVIALNEQFWDQGDLSTELNRLVNLGQVDLVTKEYGDHLPGRGVKGWVISLRKPA